jgi:hypothetical protein
MKLSISGKNVLSHLLHVGISTGKSHGYHLDVVLWSAEDGGALNHLELIHQVSGDTLSNGPLEHATGTSGGILVAG